MLYSHPLMKRAEIIFIAVLFFILGTFDAWANKSMDIDIRGTLSNRFDDNITFVNSDKRKDFITDISAGLVLSQEGKTHTLDVSGNITQEKFWDNASFDNTRQDASLNFQKELSKHDNFKLKDVLTHAEEPRSFEDAFGRTSGRYSYIRNRFELGYLRVLSKHLNVQMTYGNELYNVSRDDLSDSVMNKTGVELDYIQSSAWTFLLGYDYSTRDFNPGGSVVGNAIVAGVRRFFTPQLYLDVKPGVTLTKSVDNEDFVKATALIALTDEISKNIKAGIYFQSDSNATSSSQDIFNSWRIGGNFFKQLLRRLNGTIGAFYGRGEYESSGIEDELIGVNTRLEYEVTKNAATFLGYGYAETISNRDNRGYVKNTISLGVRVNF